MPRFSDDNDNQDQEPPQSAVEADPTDDKLLFAGSTATSFMELREREKVEPHVLFGVWCGGAERDIIDVDSITHVNDADEGRIIARLNQSITINEDTNVVRDVPSTIDEEQVVISDPTADTAYQITETEDQYSIVRRFDVVLEGVEQPDLPQGIENSGKIDEQEPDPVPQGTGPDTQTPAGTDAGDTSANETPTPTGPAEENSDTIEATQPETVEPHSTNRVSQLDINREVAALSSMFESISRDDFYRLDNGNVGVEVGVIPSSDAVEQIDLVIEYTGNFPEYPPRIWVLRPDLPPDYESVVEVDQRGDTRIQVIDVNTWTQYRDTRVVLDHLEDWIIRFCQRQEQTSPSEVVRETTEYVADRGQEFIQDVRDRRSNEDTGVTDENQESR